MHSEFHKEPGVVSRLKAQLQDLGHGISRIMSLEQIYRGHQILFSSGPNTPKNKGNSVNRTCMYSNLKIYQQFIRLKMKTKKTKIYLKLI